ncbi:MFS transporter [Virgisporangium ochraceum]|uniref:MFS transporter n=1 Tax=Virgisporangium ochraceum TaxID=65505 RepID=A0A8J4EFE9_9ACTN|nr:MFS transporter [Virgisporangium ochraceum]GIJ73630.1 MFS transporter [Virgisporangium ochraceum]
MVTVAPRQVGTRRVTFLVALAVFAQESTWNFYDAQVPPLVREHVTSAALVGLLMGMDNLLSVFVQPWIGNRSDNTRTAWGRRIPYIVVGMPIAALLFLLVPYASVSLPLLVAVMFGYALVANAYKPLVESLMPDFVPPQRRSRASAIIKIASAVTVIVAALISILVVDEHPSLAFMIPPVLMLVAVAVLAAMLRDSWSPAYQQALREDAEDAGPARHRPRVRDSVAFIVRDPERARLWLLVSIVLFGCAWAASRSLMTPYGMETLGMSRGDAGGMTLPGGLAFLLAAYPAALLAERFGRIHVMLAGTVLFGVALLFGAVVRTPTGTVVALAVAAVGATGFMINAVVVLWNLAPSARVLGTYTGLYAVAWAGGGFLGPALVGGMVDVTGWALLLVDIAVVTVAAGVALARAGIGKRRADAERAEPA